MKSHEDTHEYNHMFLVQKQCKAPLSFQCVCASFTPLASLSSKRIPWSWGFLESNHTWKGWIWVIFAASKILSTYLAAVMDPLQRSSMPLDIGNHIVFAFGFCVEAEQGPVVLLSLLPSRPPSFCTGFLLPCLPQTLSK